jgi:hypothetical protein
VHDARTSPRARAETQALARTREKKASTWQPPRLAHRPSNSQVRRGHVGVGKTRSVALTTCDMGYSRGTHGTHGHSRGTHRVLKGYSRGTQGYSGGTQGRVGKTRSVALTTCGRRGSVLLARMWVGFAVPQGQDKPPPTRWPGHSRGTPVVLLWYSRGTHGALTGHSRGTPGVLLWYSRGTHGVLLWYSLSS